jgi:hypothetical protein
MVDLQKTRLNDPELKALFDRMFPHGFAGQDVFAELAREGWEKSLASVVLSFLGGTDLQRVFEDAPKARGVERHPRPRQGSSALASQCRDGYSVA